MQLDDFEFVKAGTTLTNKYIEQWKAEKKKVLGYYCSYIPEEMIYALGILPFRIRGTTCTDTVLADAVVSKFNCSFMKATLNLALEDEYQFLDGMVCANSCDHIRRMFDIWKAKEINSPEFPYFFLSIPHTLTEEGLAWLKKEFTSFQEKIEDVYKVKFSEEQLSQAIDLYNKNRNLFKEIYQLRIRDIPKISGTDMLKLMVANTSAPKGTCNQELQQILDFLKDQEGIKDYRARLMLVGSYTDNPNFIHIFEEVGGLIVTDTLCNGVRYFWDEIQQTADSFNDLVARYYYKISCPRMMDSHQSRLEFIKDQIKRAKIDGVILQRIEFCDLHGADNMLYSHELEDLNIPVLNIDREYLMSDVARFKTRVEAFIEQILVGA
ncbi:MAG: 2-hydroxyacyl-CoA dehydratase subunit D [Candidatus Helarchaeota archaeon]